MKVRSAEVDKGVLTVTIEIPLEDHQPFLDWAARELSKERPVAGFRPGNAPYAVVAREFGDHAVLEYAAERMVASSYSQAIEQEKFTTIGSPKIQVEMMAVGNPFIYSATALLLPEVTVGDMSTVRVEERLIEISDGEIAGTLEELRELQATESLVKRPAGAGDVVVVDIAMNQNGVPVEGGSVQSHTMYLDKPYYIPGLTKEIVGMEAGSTKVVHLTFPNDHYQKHLAGKQTDFIITLKEVRERVKPALTDGFAARLGQANIEALKNLLKENIRSEKERKESDRQERAMLEQLVKRSKYSDIPEQLVAQEAQRMVEELEDTVRRQGGEFQAYLDSLKKSHDDLLLEFAPKAVERVKTALLLRSIAADQSLSVTLEEIGGAIAQALEHYKDNPEMKERIQSPEMREQVATLLRNRKAIAWIKTRAVHS